MLLLSDVRVRKPPLRWPIVFDSNAKSTAVSPPTQLPMRMQSLTSDVIPCSVQLELEEPPKKSAVRRPCHPSLGSCLGQSVFAFHDKLGGTSGYALSMAGSQAVLCKLFDACKERTSTPRSVLFRTCITEAFPTIHPSSPYSPSFAFTIRVRRCSATRPCSRPTRTLLVRPHCPLSNRIRVRCLARRGFLG